MRKQTLIVGILCIAVFILISGFQATFLSDLLQQVNLFSTVFISFFITTTFYLTCSIIRGNRIKTLYLRGGTDLFYINLTTLGNWLSFFIAIKYLEPAIVASIANAVNPLLTIFIVVAVLRTERLILREYILIMIILLGVIALIMSSYSGNSAANANSSMHMMLGFLMSALCGASVVMHTFVSKRLNRNGVEPSEIMSIRFILITIVAYCCVDNITISNTVTQSWDSIVFITMLGNIIGIYLLQAGIKLTPVLIVSYLHTAKPAVYFFLSMLSLRIHFSLYTMTLVIFMVVCLAYMVFVSHQKQIIIKEKEVLK